MTVKVRHIEGVRFEAEARGHKVLCDQPLANGGGDLGMTPPELLLSSLATCAGYYAAEYMRTRQLPMAGLEVEVDAAKAAQPARLAEFKIKVTLPALTDRHREGLMRAVKSCLIHNTLLHAPAITIELEDLCPASLG